MKMPRGIPIKDVVIEQFLEVVKVNSFLYDACDTDHLDIRKMKHFWDGIAQMFNVDGMDAMGWRSKWKNLRDTYMKHRKLIMGPCSNGNNKTTKWKFYDRMTFLEPYMPKIPMKVKTETEDPEETQQGTDDEKDNTINNNILDQADESAPPYPSESQDEGMSTEASQSPYPWPRHSRKRRGRRKRSYKEEGIEETVNNFMSQTKRSRLDLDPVPQDADLLLFQSYALRMKRLPSDLQAVVTMQMSQIFYNIENPHLQPIPVLSMPAVIHRAQQSHERSSDTNTPGEIAPSGVSPVMKMTFYNG